MAALLYRLDKLTADVLGCPRKEAVQLIRQGRIAVDGSVCTVPETRVKEKSLLAKDGRPLREGGAVYLLMNKPLGFVCSAEDDGGQSVLALVPEQLSSKKLFSVGRLDKNTTGALMLTDDGDLAHRLLAPSRHVPKMYRAVLDGELSAAAIRRLEAGIGLGNGEQCLPCRVERLQDRMALVTLEEGKYHQVRRMFAAVGLFVEQLERISFGPLNTEGLELGKTRPLTAEEIALLKGEKE
ncbi:MAG: 16S rRNA pseudouridine(516) synthase [Clostridia bacterium]|nr:16S rRNA pseudouridine(516) synthase [Clostridia bacterium]